MAHALPAIYDSVTCQMILEQTFILTFCFSSANGMWNVTFCHMFYVFTAWLVLAHEGNVEDRIRMGLVLETLPCFLCQQQIFVVIQETKSLQKRFKNAIICILHAHFLSDLIDFQDRATHISTC